MSSIESYSLGINFLDYLRTELVNFRGFKSLAFELIQNAQDCGAEWIKFEFSESSLKVSNSQQFQICSDMKSHVCNEMPPCDFHRLRNVAGGGKRFESQSIGNFGIGFISVYAYTDTPTIRSGTNCWTIIPNEGEEERLKGTVIAPIDYTEFELPWAFDLDSPIRRALGGVGVKKESIAQFVDALCGIAPNAILFLETLQRIEIVSNGTLVKAVTKDNTRRSDGIISIADGDATVTWHLFRSQFDKKARDLRSSFNRHNHTLIEDKRRADVMLAFSADCSSEEGLLYAHLPTESSSKFPFHINADFFPATDRKRIILDGNEHERHWNEAALLCAAQCFAEDMETIGPDTSAHTLLSCLSSAKALERQSVWSAFWEQVKLKVEESRIIFCIDEDWVVPSQAFMFTGELSNHGKDLFADLEIKIVDPELKGFRNILQTTGVRDLDLNTVRRALDRWELDGAQLELAPPLISLAERRRELYKLIENLVVSRGSSKQLLSEVNEMAIAIDLTGKIRRVGDLYRAELPDDSIFMMLFPDRFASAEQMQEVNQGLWTWLPEFNVDAALKLLTDKALNDTTFLSLIERSLLEKLHCWFAEREAQFTYRSTSSKYRRLPIFPLAKGWASSEELLLPSVGVRSVELIENEILNTEGFSDSVLEFWKNIGIPQLDWPKQVERICRKFESSGSQDAKRQVVSLLAANLPQYADDRPSIVKLNGTKVVYCLDGTWHAPDTAYFDSELVRNVLGNSVGYVSDADLELAPFHSAIEVLSAPHVDDVLLHIKGLVGATSFSDETIAKLTSVLNYLDSQWGDLDDLDKAKLNSLKSLEWLPASQGGRENEFEACRPKDVYIQRGKPLFYSQAKFVAAHLENEEFLEFLGIGTVPPVELVCQHLLWLRDSFQSDALPFEVYEYLNENVSENEKSIKTVLINEPCLRLGDSWWSGKHVFWRDTKLGKYRAFIPEEQVTFKNLFKSIGVRERCSNNDYADVIIEIAGEYGCDTPLNDESLGVLKYCFSRLNKLAISDQDNEFFQQFDGVAIIPNALNMLKLPSRTFFADKTGLSEALSHELHEKLVTKERETAAIYERLGVRPLNRSLRRIPASASGITIDSLFTELVTDRKQCLQQVIERQKETEPFGWREYILSELEIWLADELTEIIAIPELNVETPPRKVDAIYDEANNRILVERLCLRPHLAIAKELSAILNPSINTCNIVSTFNSVLLAHSQEYAQQFLFSVGFDVILSEDAVTGVSSNMLIFEGAGAAPRSAPSAGSLPPQTENMPDEKITEHDAVTSEPEQRDLTEITSADESAHLSRNDESIATETECAGAEVQIADPSRAKRSEKHAEPQTHKQEVPKSGDAQRAAEDRVEVRKKSSASETKSLRKTPKKVSFREGLVSRFNTGAAESIQDEWFARSVTKNVRLRSDNLRNEIREAKKGKGAPSFRYRMRKVWSQKNETVRAFLQSEYGGRCQICSGTFLTRQQNWYFESMYIVSRLNDTWLDRSGNALCLCAGCCAKMQLGSVRFGDDENIVEELLRLDPSDGESFYQINFSLCGEPVTLRISQRHLSDITTMLSEDSG